MNGKLDQPWDEQYQFAAIVRLTMDDPVNDRDAGLVEIIAGRCEDGVAHSVFYEDDFLDIECEVLGLLRADTEMTDRDIKTWATQRANTMNIGSKHPEL